MARLSLLPRDRTFFDLFILIANLMRTRVGRALITIRDNEIVAKSMGSFAAVVAAELQLPAIWLLAAVSRARRRRCHPAPRPGDPRISGASGPGQTGITGRQLIKGPGLAFLAMVRRLRDQRGAS